MNDSEEIYVRRDGHAVFVVRILRLRRVRMHVQICPFEPVKHVVRDYVREIKGLRQAIEMQEEEVGTCPRARVCVYACAYVCMCVCISMRMCIDITAQRQTVDMHEDDV